VFVTFEGPEGAGKSTLIAALAVEFEQHGRRVVRTREPGATSFGTEVRRLLLEGDNLSAETELFLFLADRANHVQRTLLPALREGAVVLCDRYADSTLVYQGYGRGLDLAFLRRANEFATGGLRPDLTLLLDLDPEAGLARLDSKDRLDREPIEFHRRIRAGFLAETKLDPDRWILIDASAAPDRVLAQAKEAILRQLSGEGGE